MKLVPPPEPAEPTVRLHRRERGEWIERRSSLKELADLLASGRDRSGERVGAVDVYLESACRAPAVAGGGRA